MRSNESMMLLQDEETDMQICVDDAATPSTAEGEDAFETSTDQPDKPDEPTGDSPGEDVSTTSDKQPGLSSEKQEDNDEESNPSIVSSAFVKLF